MNLLRNSLVIKLGNFLSGQIIKDEHQAIIDCLEEDGKAIYADLGCLDGNTTTIFARKIKPKTNERSINYVRQ